MITSVHILFDESIPERSADCVRELDEVTVKVDPEERRVTDLTGWSINTTWRMNCFTGPRGSLCGRVSSWGFVLSFPVGGRWWKIKLRFTLMICNR